MITAALLLLLVVVIAVFLWRTLRGQGAPVRDLNDLISRSKPVDLQSFRNLIDPAEESYLRAHLRPSDFRRLQRNRMLAAMQYVSHTAHNAALLLKIANLATRASDPEVSRTGAELGEAALHLRVYSIAAMFLFGLRFLVPTLPLRISDVASRYEILRDRVAGLTRIQHPASVSEVQSAL